MLFDTREDHNVGEVAQDQIEQSQEQFTYTVSPHWIPVPDARLPAAVIAAALHIANLQVTHPSRVRDVETSWSFDAWDIDQDECFDAWDVDAEEFPNTVPQCQFPMAAPAA